MTRHFCICLSLKTGAIIMSFLNLFEGSVEIITGIIGLSNLWKLSLFKTLKLDVALVLCNLTEKYNHTTLKTATGIPGVEGNTTLYTTSLVFGLLAIISGVILLVGLVKAKERHILLYILLSSVNLFTVAIFAVIYMFTNKFLLATLIFSLFMCYGQLAMYYFYEEISEYNTVNSGAIEIIYRGDPKSYANSVLEDDDAFENTDL